MTPHRHCERKRSNPESRARLWIASSLTLLAMTEEEARGYRTTPDVNPALRRGGLMSFFKKQCASFPA
jgi:hypothetical protein